MPAGGDHLRNAGKLSVLFSASDERLLTKGSLLIAQGIDPWVLSSQMTFMAQKMGISGQSCRLRVGILRHRLKGWRGIVLRGGFCLVLCKEYIGRTAQLPLGSSDVANALRRRSTRTRRGQAHGLRNACR
ncbi:protein of unknown function [Candidatus Filomicrobium marinum]|uniref:Uncharacterized protein n=1 Tax=Candidatus Filomicrobium marinum TaxID=1608628 RepID=A0A0D6JFD4_9HYPH|nr:protein of unknown function [Candidatus Filomicrobium marinum]CPR19157.1 protein of unknown function [Candidatus Filomicrobium marinum]